MLATVLKVWEEAMVGMRKGGGRAFLSRVDAEDGAASVIYVHLRRVKPARPDLQLLPKQHNTDQQ